MLRSAVPLVVGVAVVACGGLLRADPINIDDFRTNGMGFGEGGLLLEAVTIGESDSATEDGINGLGKERITTVTLLEGTRAFVEVNSAGAPGIAVLGVDGDSRGQWQFEYGTNDPWWDDLVGTVGNRNLGARFLDADAGGMLTIEVRDRLAGIVGEASTPIAAGAGFALIPFEEFSGVDFTDVTYVRFQIDGAAGGGYTVDSFAATNIIPAPSAAHGGMLLLLFVMILTRRRPRHRRLGTNAG